MTLEEPADGRAALGERAPVAVGDRDLERALDGLRRVARLAERLPGDGGDEERVEAAGRMRRRRLLEDRLGAAVGRERVAVREADGRDGERVVRILAVVAVPRARAERIEPRPHDRAGDRKAVVDGAQERPPAVGVAARDGEVAAQRADRVRGGDLRRGVGRDARGVGARLRLGELVAQPVHGRLRGGRPRAGRGALPPGGGGERARRGGGLLGAREPAREELERRGAAEAFEQHAVAPAVDRERGGGVEGVGRGLPLARGELGHAEVEERERAPGVVDRHGGALAIALAPDEEGRRVAGARDIGPRPRAQQRREGGDIVVGPAVDAGEEGLGPGRLARAEAGAGGGDGEAPVGRGELRRRDDGLGRLAAEQEVEPLLGEHVDHAGHVPGLDDVRQGLAPVAVRGEPHRRPGVQPRPQRGRLEAEARAQQLGEQRVVAEPALVAVDRRQEDPGAVEVGEHAPAVVVLGQRVGELAADLLGDARAQQEAARLGRLQREDLAAQVVGDRVVVAGELGEEGLGVVLALERERREPQPRGPALGALDEPFGLIGAERRGRARRAGHRPRTG